MTDAPASHTHGTRSRFCRPRAIATGPVLAVALSAGVAGWMLLGPSPVQPASDPSTAPESIRSVRVIPSTAEASHRTLTLQGETQPRRVALVSSSITASVSEIIAVKGQLLDAGDPIAILRSDGLDARAAEAAARLEAAREDLHAKNALHDRGIATAEALRAARTSLAAAEAGWAAIETERQDQVLRAPFAGTIDDIAIVLGDRVSPGEQVATMIDTSSLIVESALPQVDLSLISVGQDAMVYLSTGESIQGVVTFLSRKASSETRSFPFEVEVRNADLSLPAGASARIEIAGPETLAHDVSTADLSMDDDGRLNIKVVENDRVQSYPIKLLTSRGDRVLVTGLPVEARIITTGQSFVRSGEQVISTEVSSK